MPAVGPVVTGIGSADTGDAVVHHNPELQRYELMVDGSIVGIADYRERNGELHFPHTQVDPAHGGQGLGTFLVGHALDDVRANRSEAVVPTCWFVAAFIADRPDYADLLEPSLNDAPPAVLGFGVGLGDGSSSVLASSPVTVSGLNRTSHSPDTFGPVTDWSELRARMGDDGRKRCHWPGADEQYLAYHDHEWGRPVTDDVALYEKLCLEGFQSGLAWITILRKRENFRSAFAGFDPERVAAFDGSDIERLLGDAGIVRHRGKIEAAIANAHGTLAAREQYGSLAAVVWSVEPKRARRPAPTAMGDLAAQTPESSELSKRLKRLGFRFVGPTTAYAAMQSLGVVNDHLRGCFARAECEADRRDAAPPVLRSDDIDVERRAPGRAG